MPTSIELHVIQNFAPSNLNRDDTGSPKDCYFGGHRRARISSQCIKRAIRTHPSFRAQTDVDESFRTKYISRLFKPSLIEHGKPEDEIDTVITAFTKAYVTIKSKKEAKVEKDEGGDIKSSVLLYMGVAERDGLIDVMLANWDKLSTSNKKERTSAADAIAKEIAAKTEGVHAPDVAMFGRMLAGSPVLNIDAASHIAHAISTHAIHMEDDYFTAVDDLQKQGEETGASMIGFKQFNSPCYYRYACIDFEQLQKNLLGDPEAARRAVAGFLHALVKAVPTGMQSGFAAYNEPALLFAVVRRDGQFWNLVNAFERPVVANTYTDSLTGVIEPSIRQLERQWRRLTAFYDDAEIVAKSVHTFDYEDALGDLVDSQTQTLTEWVTTVTDALTEA